MGSTRKFKRKAKKQKEGDDRKPYVAICRESEGFVKYYKAQKLMSDEEWVKFLEVMKTDLPTAFRIMGSSRGEARRILEIVRGEFFSELLKTAEGKTEPFCLPWGEARRILEIVRGEFFSELLKTAEGKTEPFCLPWYPEGLGWQMELTRKDIRRSEAYFRLHNFLTSETACGAISRQEAVSMIPPLVLDVQPHHKVLDMCAAPGSKTAQLIELLHSDESKLPEGFVVANDIDNTRCYMLVHQAKRLNSPCVMVTNHDSGAMPNFKTSHGGTNMKFDRILCDVPCCGDGTLRKNPDIWQKWNTANGNNLHGVQYRILRRGLEMLKVGGKIVYSTCSLNPVEDEAVIVRILAETGASVELLDISERLPGLRFRPGVTRWYPASKDLVLYDSYEEVEEKWRTQVRPSMFPPDPTTAHEYHLERCVRVLPHLQDTGGFFVSALTKKSALPWESPEAPAEASAAPGEASAAPEPPRRWEPVRKKRRVQGYREDPYVFFKEDEPVWISIRDFYGIEGLDPTCLLTRCATGKKKNIYFVSPVLRDILVRNQNNIKVINTGVKVFSRCDNKSMGCCFRLVQEGLESIKSMVGPGRRVKVSREELVSLLQHSDPTSPLETSLLSRETQDRLQELSQGSCVLELEDELRLSLVGWKGSRSLRAYVASSDLVHYLRVLGADVSKFDVNKFKKDAEGAKEGVEEDVDGAKEEVEEDVDGAKEEVEDGVDGAKEEVEDGVDGAKEQVEEDMEVAKEEVEDDVKDAKEGVQEDMEECAEKTGA